MDRLINFLSHASAETQVLVFSITLLLCWNIENIAGLTSNYRKWNHSFLNVKFIFTNIPLQFILGIFFAKTLLWTSTHHFGIIYNIPFLTNHLWVFIASFVLLDLGEYLYHVLMHKIKKFWMFHMVHHSDKIVDVSTTLREHPGENLIRNTFTLLWIFLIGVPFWALLLRQIIQIFSNIFSHINYRIPEKLDTVIGWLFITPNLHHVHHHYKQPYTDCNYGDVLSIWDRLFGTFCRLPAGDIVFGVDTCMDEKENSKYFTLIKMPFGRYKKNNKA